VANINVRGIPDRTKEALRLLAARAGTSLEAYARRALIKASLGEGREPVSIVDLAEKHFGAERGVELDLPLRSTRRRTVEFS
jgi:plasmid stability protein